MVAKYNYHGQRSEALPLIKAYLKSLTSTEGVYDLFRILTWFCETNPWLILMHVDPLYKDYRSDSWEPSGEALVKLDDWLDRDDMTLTAKIEQIYSIAKNSWLWEDLEYIARYPQITEAFERCCRRRKLPYV